MEAVARTHSAAQHTTAATYPAIARTARLPNPSCLPPCRTATTQLQRVPQVPVLLTCVLLQANSRAWGHQAHPWASRQAAVAGQRLEDRQGTCVCVWLLVERGELLELVSNTLGCRTSHKVSWVVMLPSLLPPSFHQRLPVCIHTHPNTPAGQAQEERMIPSTSVSWAQQGLAAPQHQQQHPPAAAAVLRLQAACHPGPLAVPEQQQQHRPSPSRGRALMLSLKWQASVPAAAV